MEERIVRCNMCMWVGVEEELEYNPDTDEERCPACGQSGYIMDLIE